MFAISGAARALELEVAERMSRQLAEVQALQQREVERAEANRQELHARSRPGLLLEAPRVGSKP